MLRVPDRFLRADFDSSRLRVSIYVSEGGQPLSFSRNDRGSLFYGAAWENLEDWVEQGLPAYQSPMRLQGQGIEDSCVEVPLGALLFIVYL